MKSRFATARILTDRPAGHTLNRRQVLSPDGLWCVFDSRNNDPDIGITQTIERAHLKTGEIELLYSTPHSSVCNFPTAYGPGVGAAAYHPQDDKVIFIHGLNNCSAERPYAMTRRYGAVLDINSKKFVSLESRVLRDSVPWGRLSGGTHAHSWSPSGERISFTYDDAIATDRARTVGFGDLQVRQEKSQGAISRGDSDNSEIFYGAASCFLLANCHSGTYLQQAVEECWVGENRIAFLGRIACPKSSGTRLEIFLAHLPNREQLSSLVQKSDSSLGSGDSMTEGCHSQDSVGTSIVGKRPSAIHPRGAQSLGEICRIEQLTDFGTLDHPGVQGPRHWLVSDPQGQWVYALCKDSQGIVQLVRIHSETRRSELLTELTASIEGQCGMSRDGRFVSFVSGDRIHRLCAHTGDLDCLTVKSTFDKSGHDFSHVRFSGGWVGAPHFVDDQSFLLNRYVLKDGQAFLQIVLVAME